MLALRWSDVDLDAGRIAVATAFEGSHAHTTKAPKTKSGRRTISLPASTVEELRTHRRTQQERRLAVGMGRVPADAYVFSDDTGRALGPNAITCAWPRAMRAIGMPEINLHSLRHTHASVLIASGTDVLTISRRLGHSTPTVTLKVYGHLIHGSDDKAASIMEAAFGKIKG
jgi:integrase